MEPNVMANVDSRTGLPGEPELPPDIQHPRGTLAIVIVFGALFALGWLAMYFLRFLAGGAPHH
jgi:hypothetical protein